MAAKNTAKAQEQRAAMFANMALTQDTREEDLGLAEAEREELDNAWCPPVERDAEYWDSCDDSDEFFDCDYE